MDDRLSHRRQNGLTTGEIRRLAADHESEGRPGCTADAARYRRVEHGVTGIHRLFGNQTRRLDVDRRAVDEKAALAGDRQYALFAEIDGTDMRPGRQHGDDDVAAGGRLGGARSAFAAARGEGLERAGAEIETGHLMAGFQQVGGHRGTHIAEADEPDRRHVSLPRLFESQLAVTNRPEVEIDI